MHGVVTLLPAAAAAAVEEIWDELEVSLGLAGIRVTPYPHFSWHVAERYQVEQLEAVLEEVARRAVRCTVHAGGVGVFTGPEPVVYVPVVRTAELDKLHGAISDAASRTATDASPYYGSAAWLPHITLAQGRLPRRTVGDIAQRLAGRSIDWTLDVDHLAFLWQPADETARLSFRIPFGRRRAEGRFS